MRTDAHRFGAVALFLIIAGVAWPQAIRREGFVTDQAGVVDPASEEGIRSILSELLNRTDYDVAIVTVRTAPGGVEGLADSLARAWNTDGNLGLVIVVAVDDRAWRIAPSSELEGLLSSSFNNGVADRCFKPQFRAGNYGAGLLAAVHEIAVRIPVRSGGTTSYPSSSGNTPPPPTRYPTATSCGGPGLCTGIGCVVAFLFVMGILNTARRWTPGGWGGGGGYWSRPYGGGGWGGGWGRSYGPRRSWGSGWGSSSSSGWSSGRSSWGSSGGSSFRSSSSSTPRRTSFGGGGTSGSW